MDALDTLYEMGISFISTANTVVDFLQNTYTIGNTEYSLLTIMFGVGIVSILGLILVKSILF